MVIEKIIKMKNNKYKIVLSNHEDIVTFDEVIIKNNLLNKEKLDFNLINKIIQDNEYYTIYNKVLKYISIRLRSEKEIQDYLIKNNISESSQKKMIEELKNNGYINDRVFAQAYINDKINLSREGPFKIKKDLQKQNIDNLIIEKLILEIDEEIIKEKLYKLIKKRIKSNKKHSKYRLKNNITSSFMLLGYPSEMINEMFEELYVDDKNIIVREYEKAYNKLSRKYDEKDLQFKIKQTLYQKGFTSASINEVVNKNIKENI